MMVAIKRRRRRNETDERKGGEREGTSVRQRRMNRRTVSYTHLDVYKRQD